MKTIPNFPDYAVTKDGRVWSKPRKDSLGRSIRGCWLSLLTDKDSYLKVGLFCRGKIIQKHIHSLVLETYVGPRPENMQCRHLDGNPKNNNLSNLRWGTAKENVADAIKHGTKSRGESHHWAKIKNADILIIRYLRDVAKFSLSDLAWQFDVSKAHISRICKLISRGGMYAAD